MTSFNLSTQQGYDCTTEEMKPLLADEGEAEDWGWFEVTDEFEFVDEEEKSEIKEMEEDRKFYSSRM